MGASDIWEFLQHAGAGFRCRLGNSSFPDERAPHSGRAQGVLAAVRRVSL